MNPRQVSRTSLSGRGPGQPPGHAFPNFALAYATRRSEARTGVAGDPHPDIRYTSRHRHLLQSKQLHRADTLSLERDTDLADKAALRLELNHEGAKPLHQKPERLGAIAHLCHEVMMPLLLSVGPAPAPHVQQCQRPVSARAPCTHKARQG